MAQKYSPFSDKEIDSLFKWQYSNFQHPFTCCGKIMSVRKKGMYCKNCKRIQNWVHDFMIEFKPTYCAECEQEKHSSMTYCGNCKQMTTSI